MAEIVNGVHEMSEEERYVQPREPAVQKKLEWFMDLKLGFMMHWAPASQYGLMESWPLCEDQWTKREITWTDDMEEFRRQYWAANKTFNPIKFRPDRWASLAKSCGFKYLLSASQPDLLVADRTVGGEYENILTPEQTIPAKPIRVPWESCLTLGDSFSFHYTDNYKSAGTLVHILIDIVSKGGNLALNITPQPDGELPARGLLELRRMGRWLSVNGEGIYGTRIAKGFTANREVKCTRKGNTVYAFNLYDDFARLPRNIPVDIDRTVVDKAVCKVTLLRNGEDVPFTQDNKGIMLKTSELDPYGPEYADCYVLKFGD